MKISILSDNYPPEMNANARIVSELANYWQKTEKVSIITSHPNFPRGKIFENHKNKWVVRKNENNINVIRLKTYIHKNDGFVRRTLDFLSFGMHAFIYGIFKQKDDVIIGVSPQLFCALSACLIALVKRSDFIFILCDLWPDSILHTGNLKKGLVFRLLKKIENYMYKKASLIATLSPNYNQYLVENGICAKKIITSISGVDQQFYPRVKNKALISQYNLRNKFVIAYIGNFGVAQNHEDILETASSLQKEHNLLVHFLMIGDGVNREKLIKECKKLHLQNVTIDGPFSKELIPEYWSVADVAVITLADIASNATVIPSKMLESMAMAKPLVLYAPQGEAKKFLEQSRAGLFIEIGNKVGLKDAFAKLKNDPELIKKFSANALLFSQKYTRKDQADKLLKAIKLSLSLRKNKNFNGVIYE